MKEKLVTMRQRRKKETEKNRGMNTAQMDDDDDELDSEGEEIVPDVQIIEPQ